MRRLLIEKIVKEEVPTWDVQMWGGRGRSASVRCGQGRHVAADKQVWYQLLSAPLCRRHLVLISSPDSLPSHGKEPLIPRINAPKTRLLVFWTVSRKLVFWGIRFGLTYNNRLFTSNKRLSTLFLFVKYSICNIFVFRNSIKKNYFVKYKNV